MNATATPNRSVPQASEALINFLRRLPRRQHAETVRCCPVRLLATGLTVVPLQQTGQLWLCLVLAPAGGCPPAGPVILAVTDDELETGILVMPDPQFGVDDATFGPLWQARVRQRCADPMAHQVAGLLVKELLPGRRVVNLDPAVTGRLLAGVRLLRPPGLSQLLSRLAGHGLLVLSPAAEQGDGCASVKLVAP